MEKNTTTLAKYLYSKEIFSSLKIQKLLFFLRVEEIRNNKSYGFFKENNNFEAWIYGPVNRESFNEMRKLFTNSEEKELFILSDDEINEIDKLYGKWLNKYINMSANELIDISHKNQAWINARGDIGPDMPCTNYLEENETFTQFIK